MAAQTSREQLIKNGYFTRHEIILHDFKKYNDKLIFMSEDDFDSYIKNVDSIDFEERLSSGIEYEFGFIHFLIFTKYGVDFSSIINVIDVNLYSESNCCTALHYALQYSATKSSDYYVDLLLQCKKIEVNKMIHDYHTPLTYALINIENVSYKSIESLLNHKDIDVNLYGDDYPPIYYIVNEFGSNHNHDNIYKLVLKNPDLDFSVDDIRSFETLLSSSVNIEKINEFASIIMEHPNFDVCGYYNNCADYVSNLCSAIAMNNNFVIHALLEKGAHINAEDVCYISPLNIAITNKNYDVVFKLLEYGDLEFADTNADNCDSDPSSFELVLEMDDNIDIAYRLIEIYFNSNMFSYLHEYPDGESIFSKYIMSDKVTISGIDCFFSHSDFSIDSNMYCCGKTLLMKYFSSDHFSLDIFWKILEHPDVDASLCDDDGNNLLMYYLDLVKHNVNPDIVNMILMKGGFDINHQNINGNTALIMAIQNSKNENTEAVVKTLLDIDNINVYLSRKDGFNALIYALNYHVFGISKNTCIIIASHPKKFFVESWESFLR